jgi:hypothetical protein
MTTKYFYKPIISICFLLAFGSCKKYLDQQPITDVTPIAVFKDVPSAYQALIGVYSRLAGRKDTDSVLVYIIQLIMMKCRALLAQMMKEGI